MSFSHPTDFSRLNETYNKALVFCNTKAQADRLGGLLRSEELISAVLHGDLNQDKRKYVMDLFVNGKTKVLLASDVAARGLDIHNVDLVINFDMACSGDDYAHRIGRAGRDGRMSRAIAFINHLEWNLMISIERYLRIKFERRVIKGLKANYKGPKNVKASGKAVGSKKKKRSKKIKNKT